jgi:squalene-hopene/tetraprenyl-beta-curcumene cyclase
MMPAPPGRDNTPTAASTARESDEQLLTLQPSRREQSVGQAIARARDGLLSLQRADGHWRFELEADSTLPAEYVLMMHFMDEIEPSLERRLGAYIRAQQNRDGGWSLYPGGGIDVSCSVKAYYALKLIGDATSAPHMRRARTAILERGGAARVNVFTRIVLAQFEQIPWRAIPFLPAELIYLPAVRGVPFHLLRVSYWSRTVIVPLLILYSLGRRARNPRALGVAELFVTAPDRERHWFAVRSRPNRVFLAGERFLRQLEPLIPWEVRRRAIARCEEWMVARLNGEDGLGGIFPAMINAYEALDALGYGPEHPWRRAAKRALELLLVDRGEQTYCQPSLSPVWDTALSALALQEAGGVNAKIDRALGWLAERQLLDAAGDWRERRPYLAGGGWAFQYRNDRYPDLDDTAAVGWAMHRSGSEAFRKRLQRAAQWIEGMQSADGGFAAYDADNTDYYLNEIPFADHGALLDPPSEDVTARCLVLLSLAGSSYRPARDRAVEFLTRKQQPDGSWWGRWGTNYIYGTWSVLAAFEAAGIPGRDPRVRRATAWLRSIQHTDGSFGESNDTYRGDSLAGDGPSTPEQTAWALLALMAAGETGSEAVARGIRWLVSQQDERGLWSSPWFNAPGFPRVFYLHYHGYSAYFPLWALARYHNQGGSPR